MKAETLESIIRFADECHGTQLRKYTKERYVVHLIRVMQTCQQYTHDPAILSAALLHDVLEDTSVTQDEIAAFLKVHISEDDADRALRYVVDLTDIFIHATYPKLNRRDRRQKEALRLGSVSPEAQTIKYADIMDNAADIVLHDRAFGYVYLSEAKAILDEMKKGDPVLRERALHTVAECLERVRKVDVESGTKSA